MRGDVCDAVRAAIPSSTGRYSYDFGRPPESTKGPSSLTIGIVATISIAFVAAVAVLIGRHRRRVAGCCRRGNRANQLHDAAVCVFVCFLKINVNPCMQAVEYAPGRLPQQEGEAGADIHAAEEGVPDPAIELALLPAVPPSEADEKIPILQPPSPTDTCRACRKSFPARGSSFCPFCGSKRLACSFLDITCPLLFFAARRAGEWAGEGADEKAPTHAWAGVIAELPDTEGRDIDHDIDHSEPGLDFDLKPLLPNVGLIL